MDTDDFIAQMKLVIRDENREMEARLEEKLSRQLEQKLDPIKQDIEDIKLILTPAFWLLRSKSMTTNIA